jgi:hypothetical protein
MGLDVFQSFATDEKLEAEGTWREIKGGAKLLVARAGNSAYAKALTKQFDLHQNVLQGDDQAAEDKSSEIMIDVTARTILLGWEGISYLGKPMDYSVENAKTLLKIKDFRRLVQDLAQQFDAYKVKEEEKQGEA